MQIDQKALARLLTMNDEQLGALIQKIATEAGIKPEQLGLTSNNIDSIRQALRGATDEDLKQLNIVYEGYRQNKRKS